MIEIDGVCIRLTGSKALRAKSVRMTKLGENARLIEIELSRKGALLVSEGFTDSELNITLRATSSHRVTFIDIETGSPEMVSLYARMGSYTLSVMYLLRRQEPDFTWSSD